MSLHGREDRLSSVIMRLLFILMATVLTERPQMPLFLPVQAQRYPYQPVNIQRKAIFLRDGTQKKMAVEQHIKPEQGPRMLFPSFMHSGRKQPQK